MSVGQGLGVRAKPPFSGAKIGSLAKIKNLTLGEESGVRSQEPVVRRIKNEH
jgi:hypothetical protein